MAINKKLSRGPKPSNSQTQFSNGVQSGRKDIGDNNTLSPGSSCRGQCMYSGTGGSFDQYTTPCPSNCQCPPMAGGLPLVSGCRSDSGQGMVRRRGGKINGRFKPVRSNPRRKR